MPFGDRLIDVELPDSARVVSPGLSLPIAPVDDVGSAAAEALDRPLDRPPLRQLARRGHRVTIAFDDPTVPCYAPVWETVIPLVVGELLQAGVEAERITLLCANALHRKWTHEELSGILGKEIVAAFGDRLLCHDAEDPEGIVSLGRTANGFDVELHRLATESDLVVYVNAACTRGFSGGWKSVCVGLSTWKSIRHHHTADIMSMSLRRNRMHEILDEMGAHAEALLGPERFFKVETVLANPFEVARFFAGSVAATRRAALEVVRAHQVDRRDLLPERSDIVLYGIPDWSPYAAYSHMNPLLTLCSTGLGYLGGVIEALGKPGSSVILATPCPDVWDDVHHPSYREVWQRVLPVTRDPDAAMEQFGQEIGARADYIERYRTGYGFHPIHGLLALHPLKRLRHAGRVYVAGIQEPDLCRCLGFHSARSVEEALSMAQARHGRDASIVCVRYPMALARQPASRPKP